MSYTFIYQPRNGCNIIIISALQWANKIFPLIRIILIKDIFCSVNYLLYHLRQIYLVRNMPNSMNDTIYIVSSVWYHFMITWAIDLSEVAPSQSNSVDIDFGFWISFFLIVRQIFSWFYINFYFYFTGLSTIPGSNKIQFSRPPKQMKARGPNMLTLKQFRINL